MPTISKSQARANLNAVLPWLRSILKAKSHMAGNSTSSFGNPEEDARNETAAGVNGGLSRLRRGGDSADKSNAQTFLEYLDAVELMAQQRAVTRQQGEAPREDEIIFTYASREGIRFCISGSLGAYRRRRLDSCRGKEMRQSLTPSRMQR